MVSTLEEIKDQNLSAKEHSYRADFRYTHNNPYHQRLEEYSDFVMRDHEAEAHQTKWNAEVFKREAHLCAEIGTGFGHFMMEYCQNHPDQNFVGLDYRFKRSFELAKRLAKQPTNNFRYLRAKGERLHYIFGENEINTLFYFFPDPWPKTRHHKKRLFQQNFLEAAYKVIKPGGHFFIKTDHDGYAEWMREVISKQNLFRCVLDTSDLRAEHPEHFLSSFATKFEKIFLQKGVKIKAFELISNKEL